MCVTNGPPQCLRIHIHSSCRQLTLDDGIQLGPEHGREPAEGEEFWVEETVLSSTRRRERNSQSTKMFCISGNIRLSPRKKKDRVIFHYFTLHIYDDANRQRYMHYFNQVRIKKHNFYLCHDDVNIMYFFKRNSEMRWKITLESLYLVLCIDYRCKDGYLPVSAGCVTISNPNSLSRSETGVNPGMRSWKKHLSEWARCEKAIGGFYFTKKWRAETLQPGLEFDNFKPRLKSVVFKCISLLNGSFLRVMIGVFWKSEVKTFVMVPMSPLTSPTFFRLHIYSLWLQARPYLELYWRNLITIIRTKRTRSSRFRK
jgi:hypothetical protein